MKPVLLLSRLAKNDNIPHALLFSGGAKEAMQCVASTFACYIFHKSKDVEFHEFIDKKCGCSSCNLVTKRIHPDFFEITETPISIQVTRALKANFATSPLVSAKKIAVIANCETMRSEAASAFLKLLEEPSPDAVFILLAKSRGSILPTIASRCVEIRFPAQKIAVTPNEDAFVQIFESGTLEKKFRAARTFSLKNKTELLRILDAWLLALRKQLNSSGGKVYMAKQILRIKKILSTTNANPQLLLESFFVSEIS